MLRTIGVLAFSVMFIRGGMNQTKRLEVHVEQARKHGLPAHPDLARIFSWTMIGSGVALNIPFLRRIAALVIAAQMPVVTYLGHRFWEIDDPQQRAGQEVHAFKNAAMFGAALFIAGTK